MRALQRDPSATLASLLSVAALLLCSCDDPLEDAQLLQGERVLAVRAATAEDSSSLEPGEGATFEMLLAGAEGTVDAALEYELCEAARSVRGVPYCDGEVLVTGTLQSSLDPIQLELDAGLKQNTQLALLAVACPRGTPELGSSPLEWRCSGGRRPLRFSFDAWTGSSTAPNRNPDLSRLEVSVGGTQVALESSATAPRCDESSARVAAEEVHEVHLNLGEGARDQAVDELGSEALQLSHFSTAGLFERQFSFIEPEADPDAAVEWQAPKADTAVKQYLVVRDGRGGVSWASWSFCTR